MDPEVNQEVFEFLLFPGSKINAGDIDENWSFSIWEMYWRRKKWGKRGKGEGEEKKGEGRREETKKRLDR